MAAKFEISKDHAGKFRFHLKATNGETSSNYPCTNDDRRIVRVESLIPQGLAFVVIHTSVGRAALSYGSRFSDADLGS
jgi:hypothetical protein